MLALRLARQPLPPVVVERIDDLIHVRLDGILLCKLTPKPLTRQLGNDDWCFEHPNPSRIIFRGQSTQSQALHMGNINYFRRLFRQLSRHFDRARIDAFQASLIVGKDWLTCTNQDIRTTTRPCNALGLVLYARSQWPAEIHVYQWSACKEFVWKEPEFDAVMVVQWHGVCLCCQSLYGGKLVFAPDQRRLCVNTIAMFNDSITDWGWPAWLLEMQFAVIDHHYNSNQAQLFYSTCVGPDPKK